MNIIELAKQAHGPITSRWWDMDVAALERFATLVRAQTLEEAAVACEDLDEEASWKERDELRKQQVADEALLQQALDTLAYWLEHGETPGSHDMIQRAHDALQERLK